ncbi:TIGR03667 family PPOX class F420-dependent oxidoreductase [Nocardia sp. NPDC003482]|uniref:TIGR03667 family PPOX class F420-dependent oxidoreductase n=1 Tax=Nocardia sp. NPDC004068 TaxID=3364303 RepID=UPI003691B9D8
MTGSAVIDEGTEFGGRVVERLGKEALGWLTTVGPSGTPQPNPVWFLWHGGELLVFSRPDQAKLRNIAANPRVALNLNSGPDGGDIVVLTGAARIDPSGATADEIDSYTSKYRENMDRLKYTPEGFYGDYSTLIRIVPDRVRGF